VAAFLAGHQAGQAEKDHAQQLEENKLKLMVLKHSVDKIKLDDALRAYDLQQKHAQLLFTTQNGLPAAEMTSDPVTTAQPNLPSKNLASVLQGYFGQAPQGMPTDDAASPAAPQAMPVPGAQATRPATHPVVTGQVPRPIQYPALPADIGGGAPGFSRTPRSREDLNREAITLKRAEQPPLKLGPAEIAQQVNPATGAWERIGENTNERPRAPKSLQRASVLLDGQPSEVQIDPDPTATTRVFDLSGNPIVNAAARVKPIPPASLQITGAQGGDAKAIADAIMAGEQPPDTTGLFRFAAPVRAELAKQGYDYSKAYLDWQATKKHIASLNGTQQLRLRQATETAYHSLDVIDSLADQWKGGRFPLLNSANLALAKQGAYGAPAQSVATQLEAQIGDLTSELGNVYMGGNSPTDHALQLAGTNLRANWSNDVLKDMTKLARTNLKIRLNSMNSIGPAGLSTPAAGNDVTPAATAAPSSPTLNASDAAYQAYLKSKGQSAPAARSIPSAGTPAPDLTGLQPGHGRTFRSGPFAGQTWTLDASGNPVQVK
jgi:hypothetical protein